MKTAYSLRMAPSFAAMAVHIGQVLRDIYLGTGLKMDKFREGVPYSDKTIYYHFGQSHLNTQILENYEAGLKKLGIRIDIWDVITRRRKGYSFEEAMHPTTVDPSVSYVQEPSGPSVADLLRQAAAQLEKAQQTPAPDRDKGHS